MAMTGKKIIALIARDKLSVDPSDWARQSVSGIRANRIYKQLESAKLSRHQLMVALATMQAMAEESILERKRQITAGGRIKGSEHVVAASIVRTIELKKHIGDLLNGRPGCSNSEIVRVLSQGIANWECFTHSKPWTRGTLEYHVKRIAPVVRKAKRNSQA